VQSACACVISGKFFFTKSVYMYVIFKKINDTILTIVISNS